MRYVLALAIAAGAAVSAASAQNELVTFSYDDLAGAYTGTAAGGLFTAIAVDNAILQSQGGASRVEPVAGNAIFESGFVSGANSADFTISLTVGAVAIDGTRPGAGSFVATDADGDTITGTVAGNWSLVGSFLVFGGGTSVVLAGTEFNGTDPVSTDWDMDLPGTNPYDGAIVSLTFGASDFFNTSFADRATGVEGQIVPAPGALALMGLGGLVVGRRRR